MGGPIVRDKAFFFGSYQYSKQITGLSRTADNMATLTALKPDFKPFDNEKPVQLLVQPRLPCSSRRTTVDGLRGKRHRPEGHQLCHRRLPLRARLVWRKAFGARVSSVWGSRVTTKFAPRGTTSRIRATGHLHQEPGALDPGLQLDGAFGRQSHLPGRGRQFNNMSRGRRRPPEVDDQRRPDLVPVGMGRQARVPDRFFRSRDSRNENNSNYPNGGQNLQVGVLNDPKNPAAATRSPEAPVRQRGDHDQVGQGPGLRVLRAGSVEAGVPPFAQPRAAR